MQYVVEVWQRSAKPTGRDKTEWVLVESKIPQRRGKPLPLIPFVFHGPRHSRAEVDKLPLTDILAANLDHYRLDADYKHGVHYTALPTAWVSGYDKTATLLIGSRTAWVSEQPGATAGFLEFTGQGLTTFERAMERDEQRMAMLGSRVLAGEKKVGETAEALELRQSGENSILSSIATSVSESLTQVLRWAYWWNSTEETPAAVTDAQVLVEPQLVFAPGFSPVGQGLPAKRRFNGFVAVPGAGPAGKTVATVLRLRSPPLRCCARWRATGRSWSCPTAWNWATRSPIRPRPPAR